MIPMTDDNIYKDRLLLLADKLEEFDPSRFYFGGFVGNDWKGKQDLSCGTTCCMFGFAATCPEFRALGLRITKIGNFGIACVGLEGDMGDVFSGERAADEIFDLSKNEFELLFIPIEDSPEENNFDQEEKYGFTSLSREVPLYKAIAHLRNLTCK